MSENMQKTSPLRRFVFNSPWLPLLFIALFGCALYVEFARFPIPKALPTPTKFILISNLCFLLVIALRFIDQVSRIRKPFFYSAGDRPRTSSLVTPAPLDTVQRKLAAAGFLFGADGYGEKRSYSHLAMPMVYGGLLLTLLVGSYDNYRHISGVFFQGEGAPVQLDDESTYFTTDNGILASLKGMPKLQIRRNIYKSPQWPNGAVEMSLLDKDNKELVKGTAVKDGKPVVYKRLEYHLGRFLADIPLLIVTDNLHIELQDSVKVQPLDTPVGNFTHYANFKGKRLLWDILYDPTSKTIKLLGGKDGKTVATGEYQYGKDSAVHMGQYIVRVQGLANWAEIHVISPRHMYLVFFGICVAFVGGILRILFRRQSVWLEAESDGCRVWTVGGEARKAVEG